MIHFRLSRRSMLRGLGATTRLSRFGWMNALAQSTPPDYKALVCIFLVGGNDGHNTIVPLTQSEFNAYKAGRASLTLPDGNGALLPVETLNAIPYGLNPGLTAVHSLWAQSKLAVLGNVGMLVKPITRTQFLGIACRCPRTSSRTRTRSSRCKRAFPRARAARVGAHARRMPCT
ncbi:MAG: hypothetical protein EXS36_04040 [Pedosphaera sp.]|nr:hypothetical protein [Pedosphaera sp.]